MSTVGTENLKQAIVLLSDLGEKLESDLVDGKISLTEGLGYATKLPAMIAVGKQYKELLAEGKDLDATEIEELKQTLADELDLQNDELEAAIENGAALLVKAGSLVDEIISFAKALKG